MSKRLKDKEKRKRPAEERIRKGKRVDKDKSRAKSSKKTPSKKKDEPDAGTCRVLCAELILKQKYTDEEISDLIEEETGLTYSVKRVARIRKGINEGKRERLGIPAPDPAIPEYKRGKRNKLEPVEEDDEDDEDEAPVKKKSSKKKSSKKKSSKKKGGYTRDDDDDDEDED